MLYGHGYLRQVNESGCATNVHLIVGALGSNSVSEAEGEFVETEGSALLVSAGAGECAPLII